MKIDIEALKELIAERFRGNQSWFAEEMGVNPSFLNEVLNEKKSPCSYKLCVSLIVFCEKNNLNFRKYVIFLHKNVQKNEQK